MRVLVFKMRVSELGLDQSMASAQGEGCGSNF